jgi:putative membrane protein
VARRKPITFVLSLAVLVLAVASPIDRIGEERLFSVRMLQHLMIGDLAPLLAVLGLSGPLLRPILALPPAAVFARSRIR